MSLALMMVIEAAACASRSSWRDTEVTATLLSCPSDRSDSSLDSGEASAPDTARAQADMTKKCGFRRIVHPQS